MAELMIWIGVGGIILLCLIGIVFAISTYLGRQDQLRTTEAIIVCLEEGFVVEGGGRHVYRSRYGNVYYILHFDVDGDMSGQEDVFSTAKDAAQAFVVGERRNG